MRPTAWQSMEAICASPCITMLTSVTMEARYVIQDQEAKTAAPLNSVAHMARHRFGARGNALTFPLPLEDLFRALQDHANAANAGEPLKLPRLGDELGCMARVLLKTNKKGATTEEEVKSLIHQAVVRREARSALLVVFVQQVMILLQTYLYIDSASVQTQAI